MAPFTRHKYPSLAHELFAALRVLTAATLAGVFLCAFTVPLTLESWIFLLGGTVCIIAGLAPGSAKARSAAVLAGVILVTGSVIIHSRRRADFHNIEALTGPGGSTPRSWNSWVPEQDVILLTARFLPWIGGITGAESENLIPALAGLYSDFHARYGDVPSPLVSTMLFRQSAREFDLLHFPAPDTRDSALIFLHGTGGNWPLLCWIVSEPAAKLGMNTFCPSVGPLGNWGSESGEATVRETIRFAQERGKTRIVLAGLSAGGAGAARLAPALAPDLRGLMLLFGALPGASRAGLPTLLIHGLRDERFTPDIIHWVLRTDPWPEGSLDLNAFDGTHFALIQQRRQVQDVLFAWLEKGREKHLW